jgi:hypothetical protein
MVPAVEQGAWLRPWLCPTSWDMVWADDLSAKATPTAARPEPAVVPVALVTTKPIPVVQVDWQ